MDQRKSARQILAELNLSPVRDLAEIAQRSKEDYERIIETTNEVENEMVRAEMLKVCNDSKKLHIQTLKELSNICAKEDDQAIKIADHEMRKDELNWKKQRASNEDNPNEKSIVYSAPVYKKVATGDGKFKLIKQDHEVVLEGE